MSEEQLSKACLTHTTAVLAARPIAEHNVFALMFSAGADTVCILVPPHTIPLTSQILRQTFSTLQGAFLALSLHPTAVKAAQAELDAVVGAHRMPRFDDEDALVYVRAMVMEALRWHNVLPLGVYHATTADDELRGWFIPKGTVIIANVW